MISCRPVERRRLPRTCEILGLKEAKAAVVAREGRFLKLLPAIDALSGRQKDALLTTIDGLLRNKAS